MKFFSTLWVLLAFTAQSIAQTGVITETLNANIEDQTLPNGVNEVKVPKGTSGNIKKVEAIPGSPNYIITMTVTKVGTATQTTLKPGSNLYLYWHADQSEQVVQVKNAAGKVVQNPLIASTALAIQSHQIQNGPPPKSLSAEPCALNVLGNSISDVVSQQVHHLEKVVKGNLRTIDPATEEVYTYINSVVRDAINRDPSYNVNTTSPQERAAARERAYEKRKKENREIAELLVKTSVQNGISPMLPLAMMKQESKFDKNACSVKDACGLLQLQNATAAEASGWHKTPENPEPPLMNTKDIETNIKLAIITIKKILEQKNVKGNLNRALIAYNCGSQCLVDILAHKRSIPAETKNYQKFIHENMSDFNRMAKASGLNFNGPLYLSSLN